MVLDIAYDRFNNGRIIRLAVTHAANKNCSPNHYHYQQAYVVV